MLGRNKRTDGKGLRQKTAKKREVCLLIPWMKALIDEAFGQQVIIFAGGERMHEWSSRWYFAPYSKWIAGGANHLKADMTFLTSLDDAVQILEIFGERE